jgi:hypothetical protein
MSDNGRLQQSFGKLLVVGIAGAARLTDRHAARPGACCGPPLCFSATHWANPSDSHAIPDAWDHSDANPQDFVVSKAPRGPEVAAMPQAIRAPAQQLRKREYIGYMSSRRRLAQLFVCCSIFALPAAAQLGGSERVRKLGTPKLVQPVEILDSAALHTKYGAPLDRETFHMPAGFDLVVDYGPGGQVCKLQVPALMPTTEQVSNIDVMNRRMYDFLSELVPDSMRGKEIRRMVSAMGLLSIQSTEYEHVTISQLHTGQPFDRDNVITVTFTNQSCQAATRQ